MLDLTRCNKRLMNLRVNAHTVGLRKTARSWSFVPRRRIYTQFVLWFPFSTQHFFRIYHRYSTHATGLHMSPCTVTPADHKLSRLLWDSDRHLRAPHLSTVRTKNPLHLSYFHVYVRNTSRARKSQGPSSKSKCCVADTNLPVDSTCVYIFFPLPSNPTPSRRTDRCSAQVLGVT